MCFKIQSTYIEVDRLRVAFIFPILRRLEMEYCSTY